MSILRTCDIPENAFAAINQMATKFHDWLVIGSEECQGDGGIWRKYQFRCKKCLKDGESISYSGPSKEGCVAKVPSNASER